MTDVSNEFKVEFYGEETDNVFTVLLRIYSDELTEDILLSSDPHIMLPVANVYGVVSNGLEYIFAPFDIRLPRDDKTGVVSAKITFDNLDQRIIPTLRSVTKPVKMDIYVVLSSDHDYVEDSYTGYELTNVGYDTMTIESNMTLDYWDTEPFPSGRFTPSGFPGLF